MEKGGAALVGEFTFDNPRFLTAPWTTKMAYKRLPAGSEFWEYVCEIGGGWQERFAGDSAGAN